MGTSTRTITIDTRATPGAAFARLIDVQGLSAWLPRSSTFRGPGIPPTERHDYVDRTPIGDLAGRIVAAVPPERVEFFQATADGTLSIGIVYAIAPDGDGATVTRTGTITTAGRLRWLHPVIVAVTHRENRRTMKHLRIALDADAARDAWRFVASYPI
ncbi:hypothetical protein LK09_19745 [Microbacterium mangrovi]|uniref:Polyketide cyclase n=1 Tax=Microbacterium mangrovi TaxID=1348253 RepID=A0A0B2A0T3_9MICO|nr:SRPBCC family protein [Microbacterium mangrovi]KHK95146.1 hypothetical protein LK09_19745 [Microbacterium mangrovi]